MKFDHPLFFPLFCIFLDVFPEFCAVCIWKKDNLFSSSESNHCPSPSMISASLLHRQTKTSLATRLSPSNAEVDFPQFLPDLEQNTLCKRGKTHFDRIHRAHNRHCIHQTS